MIYKTMGICFLLVFLLFSGCRNQSSQGRAAKDSAASAFGVGAIEAGSETVCIWDNAALRSIPAREKGKWLASISLGETVVYLGESQVDSSDQQLEFHKVRLSDGKEGWTLAYVLVRGAKAGAITQRSYVYSRPDLLTVTDKVFEPMDMVAISKVDGNWLEVVGNQRKKSGWIQNTGVSTMEADVALAILAIKSLREKDEVRRRQMLRAIVENPALQNSVFMAGLRAMINPTPSLEEELEGNGAPIGDGDSLMPQLNF
jgi:hypothetical protein